MKNILKNLTGLLVICLFAISCQKGEVTMPSSDKKFAEVPANGTGNTFTNPPPTTTHTTPDSMPDPDPDPTPAVKDSLKYGTSVYKSTITVTCGTTGSVYGIGASNSSPSFKVTIYLSAAPTANGSYSIEDQTGSAPSSATKAWFIVTDNSKTLRASSGNISVIMTNGKPVIFFSSVTVVDESDTSNTKVVSGFLNCK